MAIKLRSSREIQMLRKAGLIVADVLSKLQEYARPGISTGQLDNIASEMTAAAGAIPLFRGVRSPYAERPFPGAICTSVNEQVVHGIPSHKVILHDGDILSIDFGARFEGYCADAAVTVPIGEVSAEKQRLMAVTKRLLDIAIGMMAPSVRWSQVAGVMESTAKQANFSVVRDFVGHGIGTQMHEEPKVPNFVSRELLANDIILAEGMVLAVEPMVNAGSGAVKTMPDEWVVVTRDGKCSAHFEHTIAVVRDGCEVLTAPGGR